MRYFEVMKGGSGKWQAREVLSRYVMGEWKWWGHSPAGLEVVIRQLGRQLQGEAPKRYFPNLGGGGLFHLVVHDSGKIVESWDWEGWEEMKAR